jgi:hypothetical protein
MLGNYRVAAQLVASRVVLSSTELVSYCLYINIFFRLIAIGLEQFEEYLVSTTFTPKSSSSSLTSKRKTKGLLIEVMNLISSFMMPCKDPKFLYFHVKKSKLIPSNPIQVSVNMITLIDLALCLLTGIGAVEISMGNC